VGLLGYLFGVTTGSLLSALPLGLTLRTTGVMLSVHVSIVYLIKSTVLARYLHQISRGQDCDVDGLSTTARLCHAGWGIAMLVFSYLVANSIPFFSELLGLIGGVLAGPTNFALPIILYVAALSLDKNQRASIVELSRQEAVPSYGAVLSTTVSSMPTYIYVKPPSSFISDPAQGQSSADPAFLASPIAIQSSDDVAISDIGSNNAQAPKPISLTTGSALAALWSLPLWEIVAIVLIMVMVVMVIVIGVTEEISVIVAKWNQFGAPFACHGMSDRVTQVPLNHTI